MHMGEIMEADMFGVMWSWPWSWDQKAAYENADRIKREAAEAGEKIWGEAQAGADE